LVKVTKNLHFLMLYTTITLTTTESKVIALTLRVAALHMGEVYTRRDFFSRCSQIYSIPLRHLVELQISLIQ
jgi:hypothetical protein